jgi:hypothetical protein
MNIIHVKGAGSTASTTQFISRFLSSDSSRAEAKERLGQE